MGFISREQIYIPAFNLVTGLLAPGAIPASPGVDAVPGTPTALRPFNMISREVIEVQRVPPDLQPVLFMDEAIEEYTRDGRGLYHHRWTIYFHVGCTSTKGTASATILNPLIDLLETTLNPADDYNLLGLGDVINTAQVCGLSVKNLGNNSTQATARQAVAYVPFEIVFG